MSQAAAQAPWRQQWAATVRGVLGRVKPPLPLTVSEWADRNRVLSPVSSAEPGRWRTGRAEFQRGIMDACDDPDVREIWVMKSAQIGWTEILVNVIGYFSHHDPSPILALQPTLEMAQAFSKDRIAEAIRYSSALGGVYGDPKSKTSGNTLLHKTFPGGHLTLAGSNSPSSLASRPIRIVCADECDRYPASAGSEGDPFSLARKRQQTFWNRLALAGSTPTVKGLSRVEQGFETSDQRYYQVPCPHCHAFQVLRWSTTHIVWPKGKPHKAHYVCEECHEPIYDRHKRLMVASGRWEATKPFKGIAGFHIWSAYSPWVTFGELATRFIDAKDSPPTLQTYVNTELGQVWEESGDQIEPEALHARRERYDLPADVLVLVAGVDVQEDRLEVLIDGYGMGEECWSIENRVIWGDTTQTYVWDELEQSLTDTWTHANGHRMTVQACMIDSGYRPDMVYAFVREKWHQRVIATKGVAQEGRPILSAPARKKQGQLTQPVRLFTVGVDQAKSLIYGRLRKVEPGPGYLHFNESFELEFFHQLCGERQRTVWRKGFPHREWHKIRPRNEALDLKVLTLAAIKFLNPIWHTLAQAMGKPQQDLPLEADRRPDKPGGGTFHGRGKWRIK